MAKTSEQYWADRSEERLVSSEKITNANLPKLVNIYNESLRNINKEIQSIYDNYTKKVGTATVLDLTELKKAVNQSDIREFKSKIAKNAEKLGISIDKVFDERYLYRLNRLEALQAQIKLEVMSIAPKTDNIATQNFTKIVDKAYKNIQGDLKMQGITPAFATLNKKMINTIVNSKWEGGNYSTRIWGNTAKFAEELQIIIGGAFASNSSLEKTSKILRDRFGVNMSDSTRLMRTETNYFHNQSEAQSFVDDGIEEYDIETALEPCPICEGKAAEAPYKTKDLVIGENAPPFHPNDRCALKAYFAKDEATEQVRNFNDRTERLDTSLDVKGFKQQTIKNLFV